MIEGIEQITIRPTANNGFIVQFAYKEVLIEALYGDNSFVFETPEKLMKYLWQIVAPKSEDKLTFARLRIQGKEGE